jgi:hypothetical protein
MVGLRSSKLSSVKRSSRLLLPTPADRRCRVRVTLWAVVDDMLTRADTGHRMDAGEGGLSLAAQPTHLNHQLVAAS